MFVLGPGPGLFPLGFQHEVIDLFSPRELGMMQLMINQTGAQEYEDRFAGLTKAVSDLRLQDSVNRKLLLLAAMRIQDTLEEVAARFDVQFPETAPHAVILGPAFPRDTKDQPVSGTILSVAGSKVSDNQGVFGDSHWDSVEADERLSGRLMTMRTGAAKGLQVQILTHVIVGSSAPFITVDDTTGLASGDEFEIDGDGIPQDNLTKKTRSRDWAITTRMSGRFNAPSPAGAPLFGRAYWLKGGSPIPGRLKDRTINIIEGPVPGAYRIQGHNVGAGTIVIEGSPAILGTEAFWISPRSPVDTGKQRRGTLRQGDPANDAKWDTLEPGTKRRMVARSRQKAADLTETLTESMDQIDRYTDLRYHRFFGTWKQLRRFRRTARLAQRRWEQEQIRRADIEQATLELNLPLNLADEEDESLDGAT